ncbi:TonB-dependent receptor [Pseudoxanthomonas daejeonensis]|uniref:TonB-dependent receptor n=1 Tax=Pseudoxanthomonas daejeonensis TaxID=266062 RepID=UPI001F544614|nr:TonB-dependent receptor [Pseudoxanthomonas daejeonensis]UNK56167.1 TonB-dependent receptor [Pseudoxanthomonas daejeonensis]
MSVHSKPLSLISGTVLLAGTLYAASAIAAENGQSPPAEATGDATPATPTTLDAVSVTGSRVMSAGFESPTPVTSITQEQIQAEAPNSIVDYINTLPAMAGTRSPTQGNNAISSGATGMSLLDLRGLGAERTLVLVDGRRYVGSTLTGSVDANALPTGLIKGVDIVTGGASSVYGSDAVAGVVNFMLDKYYTGTKGYVQAGRSRHGDDDQASAGITFGQAFADDRGHFLINAEHATSDGVGAVRDRPWFRGWGTMVNPGWTATNGEPNRIIVPFLNRPNEAVGGLITSGPLKWMAFSPDGTPRTFDPGMLDLTGSSSSGGELDGHFASVSLKGASERQNLFARGSFWINDNFEVFAEAGHANSVVRTNSSYNYYGGSLTISRDNAYLHPLVAQAMDNAGVRSAAYGLLLGDASPRVETTTDRAVVGLSGQLGQSWTLDAYYQYGRSKLHTQVQNTSNTTRLKLAIDAVVDPASGRIVCRSSLANPGNGCVPLNTFGGANMSEQALAYVLGSPELRQTMKQEVVSAILRGEPAQLPAGPLVTAFGVEARRESVEGWADPAGLRREWLFGNFLPTNGENEVKEAFVEALVPLVADELSLNAAARVADYDYSGTAFTWKLGVTWSPLDALTVRAARSRDIRAPNLADLYQAGVTQRQSVTDPWFNNTLRNIERVMTGNLNLKPEEADTTSLGIVFSPWDNFQGAVDYYQIEIKDAITSLSNQQVIQRCYDGDTEVCRLVQRDATGAVSGLTMSPVNVAKRVIRGIDTDLIYSQPLEGMGDNTSLEMRLIATRLLESTSENPFASYDYAGENTGSSPKWRALANATLRSGPARIGASARFVGSGVLDNTWVEGVDIDDNHVPSTWYLGLSGAYTFGGERFEAYFNVDNVLDKAPVRIGNNNNGINGVLYDLVGRYYSVGLRFSF